MGQGEPTVWVCSNQFCCNERTTWPSCILTFPFLPKLPMSAAETSFQIRLGNQTDLTPNPCSPQDYLQLPEPSPSLLHPHRAMSSARQGTQSDSLEERTNGHRSCLHPGALKGLSLPSLDQLQTSRKPLLTTSHWCGGAGGADSARSAAAALPVGCLWAAPGPATPAQRGWRQCSCATDPQDPPTSGGAAGQTLLETEHTSHMREGTMLHSLHRGVLYQALHRPQQMLMYLTP